MPSIYNHENACWGIRRSSCDLFQYDLNEEFKLDKARERECSLSNVTPNTTYVHYSVSSNGYYGYQPHKAAQNAIPDTEIEMDVDYGSVNSTTSYSTSNESTNPSFYTDPQPTSISRKRQMPCESFDGPKRIRQEEAEIQVKTPIQEPHHKEYFSHHKCLMAHFV